MELTINRCAILHIPTSQYAFALNGDTVTIRLRTAKGDITRCFLFWGDRACPISPVQFTEEKMEVKWQDADFDFFEVTLTGIPKRLCYYFLLEKGSERIFYYGDEFHRELPDYVLDDGFVVEGRSEYYQFPYILRSELLQIPEWFQQAVVYNIFPDSFADEKEHIAGKEKNITDEAGKHHRAECGGTIRGICENLDYIQELGFNCLYLNPIFGAGEYHKYDIMDYFHVDPCLGSDEDFLELTQAVHERGMHIIIDGVFNHCSWESPFFEDVMEKGENSEYRDWFYELSFPVMRPVEGEPPTYACFAYEPKMPKLNTANPAVQEYFGRVGRYWIERFHVDGWRLDVANEVDKNFWRYFRKQVKQADPQAILVGEVWENAECWLRGDMLDSTMNYDFRKHCREFFAFGKISADEFADRMTDMQLRYPAQVMRGQLNLLDSHDVGRFLSLCDGQPEKWKLAFLYLCMAPGVPSVFYGDERELEGMKEPEYRQPMAWEKDTRQTESFVKEILRIRKDWIAPQDDWQVIRLQEPSRMFAFERVGRHRVRIVLNAGEECVNIEMLQKSGQVLAQCGWQGNYLAGYGYLILLMPF